MAESSQVCSRILLETTAEEVDFPGYFEWFYSIESLEMKRASFHPTGFSPRSHLRSFSLQYLAKKSGSRRWISNIYSPLNHPKIQSTVARRDLVDGWRGHARGRASTKHSYTHTAVFCCVFMLLLLLLTRISGTFIWESNVCWSPLAHWILFSFINSLVKDLNSISNL